MADETREFVRNYEFCYLTVKTPKTGQRRPFVPQAVSAPGTVQGYLVNKALREQVTEFSYEYLCAEADPIVPSIGYYNISVAGLRPCALYVDLSPARQYRKALDCGGGVRVSSIQNGSPTHLQELANFPTSRNLTLESKLLAYSLSVSPGRNFVGFREAVRLVESGEAHSVAVSRFIAIALFGGHKVPIILFKNAIAGLVDGHNVYGTDVLIPLKDFFEKKWNINLRSFKEALE